MIYLTNIDLNKNELRNAVIQPLAIAPSNPKLGQVYCDSTESKIKWYDGSSWSTIGVVVESSQTNGNIVVDGVEMTVYTLPVATESTLGGVKVGAGFTIDADGVLSRNITVFTTIREVSEEGVNETDAEVFTRGVGEAIPVEGDIFIIKTLISGDKYSFSSFVYDEGAWVAMDGNVDATNCILPADIITAGSYTQVGNVTKGKNDTGTISAAGKSVADVFQSIFTKELNPTKTDPEVTISNFPGGSHEVGTTVSPTWTATLSAGSYTYGPATGITATSWNITDTAGNKSSASTGNFTDVTVEDTTGYSITATATHGAGATPLTNLGNPYTAVQIPEGSKSKTSGTISGYRSYFYGSRTVAGELNSETVRGLTNGNGAVGDSKNFKLDVLEGSVQIIVAFPTSANKTLSKVLDEGAFGTDIVGSFKKNTVAVEGANKYKAVDYDVYVYTPDTALGANTYDVTIS